MPSSRWTAIGAPVAWCASAAAVITPYAVTSDCANTAVGRWSAGSVEPAPAVAGQVANACHAAGLVGLTCGTFGNALRFLPPLGIGEDLLEEGLSLLEDAFAGL